jgi:hypothetical protein
VFQLFHYKGCEIEAAIGVVFHNVLPHFEGIQFPGCQYFHCPDNLLIQEECSGGISLRTHDLPHPPKQGTQLISALWISF